MESSRRPPPPRPEDAIASAADHRAVGPRAVMARIVVSLAMAAALSSGDLVAVAEAQPFGSRRSVLVEMALIIDNHASAWRLNVPNDLMRQALDRPPHRDRPVDDRRTSELAAASDLAAGARRPVRELDRAADDPEAKPPPGRRAEPEPLGLREADTADQPLPQPEPVPVPEPVPEPAPERGRVVDQTSKLRLWAGGDSLGEYIGNQLLHPLADPELVEVTLDYHISTGLTRPDYFDWPGRFGEVMSSEAPPEVLVFMVGGNDNQNMLADGEVIETATPSWYAEYERRVLTIVDLTTGSHLYWIGLPPMRDEARNDIALAVNQLLRRVADEHDEVTFIELEIMFSGPAESYSAHIVDPDGQLRLARAADGVHITLTGSTWVAADLWRLIDERWSFVPISEDGPDQPLPGQPL